jgi:hypothetical protein
MVQILRLFLTNVIYIRLQVVTAVDMKAMVFYDVTLCSLVGGY